MGSLFSSLTPFQYQHPSDIETMKIMRQIPLADKLFRKAYDLGIDDYYMLQYEGSNFLVTEESYPDLHKRYISLCQRLNIEIIPKLYVEIGFPNAMTVCVEKPIIIISTDCIEYMNTEEIDFILGHELGHVQCEHVLYSQIALSLPFLSQKLQGITLGIGSFVTDALQLGIMRWYRKAEFSCDRAGLIACQSMDSAVSALAKIAGLPKTVYSSFRSEIFLEQAEEFDEVTYEKTSKFVEKLLVMNLSHPWTVMRVKELNKWFKSGRYDNIIEGLYQKVSKHPDQRYCTSCGTIIKGENGYCTNCGHSI